MLIVALQPCLWLGDTSPSLKPAGVQPVCPMAVKTAARSGATDWLHATHTSAGMPSGPGTLLRGMRFRARWTSSTETVGAPAAAAVAVGMGEQLVAIALSTASALAGSQEGAAEMLAKWSAAASAIFGPSVVRLLELVVRAGMRREAGGGASRGVSRGLGRSPQCSHVWRRDEKWGCSAAWAAACRASWRVCWGF